MKNEGLIVVGYCRVSTDNQREEGTIEIQKCAIKEYAAAHGYRIDEIFCDDGVSGGLEDRPALSQLFDHLEHHSEVRCVLIYKLDRLARDLYIQEHLIKQLERRKIRLVSIKEPNLDSGDPMRKAFRQFMGIVAELEKAFITMRLSAGRINKARKGRYAGGAPAFGYRAEEKELRVDEENAATVREIFRLKRRRVGLRQIARELNQRGMATARGGKWHAGTVRYILQNPIYKGSVGYNGDRVKKVELALI